MRLNKILFTLMTNEIWLNNDNESIKNSFSRKKLFLINQQSQLMILIRLKISNSKFNESEIFNLKRMFSICNKNLTSIEIF
jgi:hypothetical protein